MLSIQENKEISNIFVAQIFLELLAIIFDTFIFEHTVVFKINNREFGQADPLSDPKIFTF